MSRNNKLIQTSDDIPSFEISEYMKKQEYVNFPSKKKFFQHIILPIIIPIIPIIPIILQAFKEDKE